MGRTGRPRKTDLTAVTDRALEAFWCRGYSATSVADLSSATGQHVGALYQDFGDKKGVFLAALQRYRERAGQRIVDRLDRHDSPLAGLRAYLHDQVEMSWSPAGRARGCLAANTALELLPHEAWVRDTLAANFTSIRALLTRTVVAAQAAGELTDRFAPDVIAGQLLAVVEGIFVLARTADSREILDATVEVTLEALRPPPVTE